VLLPLPLPLLLLLPLVLLPLVLLPLLPLPLLTPLPPPVRREGRPLFEAVMRAQLAAFAVQQQHGEQHGSLMMKTALRGPLAVHNITSSQTQTHGQRRRAQSALLSR